MALISRVLGTVVRPFDTLLHSTVCDALLVLFLLFTVLSRPILARSHSYDNNSVPPVGSKLEQEVVNAIKVRTHILANTTINPADILDGPNKFFTDNGERTLTKFPDIRHFFTNISSKNFTSVRKRARRPVTRKNNTSPNIRKIIIFSQNKSLQTDYKVEGKSKALQDGDGSKISVGTQTTDTMAKDKQKKPKESLEDDSRRILEVTAKEDVKHDDDDDDGDQKTTDKDEETGKEEEKESSEKMKIFPTNVISDKKRKKEHKSESKDTTEDEEVIITAQQTKSVEEGGGEGEEKDSSEKIIKDKEDVSKEKTEDDVSKSEVESERDSSADIKEKLVTESEKSDAKDEEIVKIEEKEMIEGQEKDDEKEELKLDQEEKIDKEQSEKKEKRKPDTEEPDKEKKQPDSKKKEKKKTEDAATKTDEEKSEDLLETYSQFTQRVSAEKKNDATNGHGTNGHSKGSKVKGKNYASPDCGAKISSANPEASHSSKIIHPNKDDYMLNKCRDKTWFIVELCESIRPQKFDIANFELYSNLPKDIQVFGSHRYPSRDWSSFGWFKGQEGNRGIQSFRIDTEEDFFKYIKVEVTSYYGSEFFCPISTFQIYGLSEFEVMDTIEDVTEDNDDFNEPFIDPVEETTGKKTKEEGKSVIPAVLKNMFSGVMDVIKRGYRPSSSSSEPGENCYSLHPTFAVEDDICHMAGALNYIISCYKMEYEVLMLQPFVSSTVKNSSFCRQLALTMCAEPEVNDSIVYDTTCNNSYVCVMLSPKHILAMCFMQDPQIMNKGISCEATGTHLENYSATSHDLLSSTEVPPYVKNAVINTSSITRSDATDTNLSGTLKFQSGPEVIKDGKLPIEPSVEKKKQDLADIPDPESSVPETAKPPSNEFKVNGNGAKDKPVKEGGEQEATVHPAESEENLAVEGSGLGGIDITGEELLPPPLPEETNSIGSTPPPPTTTQPTEPKVSNSPTNKESVVVRLSNKIKALEYNMSISSQYLEELSRRYKRQMEDMQRQFNLTIAALNDTSFQAYERDQHHQRDIENLEQQLANVSSSLQKLIDERETLAHTVVEQHVLLMVIEVIVLCMVFTVCSRRRNNYLHNAGYAQTRRNQTPSEDPSASIMDQDSNCHISDNQGRARLRRRSVDSITSERNSRLRQRRPSEEALNISGTYQDLLIIEPAIPILMDSVSDRKKKRKSSSSGTLKRSKSNASIVDKSSSSRRAKRIEKLNMSSAGVLFCGDQVDSKTSVLTPTPSPVDAPDSLNFHGLTHEPLCNDEGSVFYDHENSCSVRNRSVIMELGLEEMVPSNAESVSKRHSIASCNNCDNVQKKDIKLSKSLSLCSAHEKNKISQEKVKKVKKQKRAKVKESGILNSDSSQTQNTTLPECNKEYYYPKPNGISYSSPIERYDNYYYNGHNSVHFSVDTNEHCDHTYDVTGDIPVNGGYSNGISSNGSDHYRHNNEFSHTNHDTISVSEKKKMSPRVKSKVKLRSDNWEWYSSQHLGGSSSETISTGSDSSGKNNRKIKKEEQVSNNEKVDEKKGKKKKKSKSKSPVLLEEEAVLEVESGT